LVTYKGKVPVDQECYQKIGKVRMLEKIRSSGMGSGEGVEKGYA